MRISREEVRRIAKLARLSLDDREAESMTAQLDRILEHVEQLRALDTAGVPPTASVAEYATPMRRDEPRPSLPPETALANAPAAAGGGFLVPRILEAERGDR